MQRLFDKLKGKETNICIKTYHEGRFALGGVRGVGSCGGSSTYKICYSKRDLENRYNDINNELQKMSLIGIDTEKLEIEINGKLDSIPINQRFSNLDLFYEFLKKNSIINSTALETKVSPASPQM